MDIILVIIAIVLVVFTITMICIFIDQGSIPDTLCNCVFLALTGECGAMAWIKTAKEKNNNRKNEPDNKTFKEKDNNMEE